MLISIVPLSWLWTGSAELGTKEFMMSLGAAYAGYRTFSDAWLRVESSYGPEAITATYRAVLTGSSDPASGQIVSLWPEDAVSTD